MFNNLFLTTACATVFVGTLYPLALEALTGDKISVGAPFFNLTFGPLFVPLLLADAVRPAAGLEARRSARRGAAADRAPSALALVAIAATFALTGGGPVLAPFAHRACGLRDGRRADRSRRAHRLSAPPLRRVAARARAGCRARPSAPRSRISALGVSLLGIVSEATWGAERIVVAEARTRPCRLRGYDLTFDGLVTRQGPNYRELIAKFTVRQGGDVDRRDGAVEAHLPGAQHRRPRRRRC